ncbi:hypothetical protein, variant 3 [Exophiala xenobiotica]|uniref:Uncharacterized protein n=1 Tax=Exophiala xenobiotica TaxID=348802 RepID=A0A0D2BKM1_9EURO|nr:hypothetical protein, variant 2 [Exophiala xenobiotica]XP_013313604.1 hypothetical protein, variant 3 [Exophiala xenobiotica]KIW53020.1 hypothetical protein, variant 2 [Exophiala xenobiotica]KIW53021.1 hypothetical protein, variant 3 [Exophiala xenobiotica]
MGKLRSPASPPTRATETPTTTFPRMDPPPPYEASASSRSTSAHSHDRLQAHPREGSPQEQHQQQPSPAQPEAQSDSLEMQGPATQQKGQKKAADGCLTFGEGASGCMTYGDHADGKRYHFQTTDVGERNGQP